jgi:hypothetical protein
MLAVFCLRLTFGLLASLVLLSHRQMHTRFFRTHFLTALGLCIVALVMGWDTPILIPTALGLLGTFVGSLLWNFERPPAGWTFWLLTLAAIGAAFVVVEPTNSNQSPLWARIINDLTSAMLLGSIVTAMLVGHSYLISPALSIRPLMVQLALVGISLAIRTAVAAAALWLWTADHSLTNLNDETVLFLPVRWLIGLAGPAFFGFLAYRTAQIRSTQSATGILYVVVILGFLGELMSLLLFRNTGLPL